MPKYFCIKLVSKSLEMIGTAMWLLFVSLVVLCKVNADESDVVYPERIHHYRTKRDLSTLKDKDHEDTLSVKIPTKLHDDVRGQSKFDYILGNRTLSVMGWGAQSAGRFEMQIGSRDRTFPTSQYAFPKNIFNFTIY